MGLTDNQIDRYSSFRNRFDPKLFPLDSRKIIPKKSVLIGCSYRNFDSDRFLKVNVFHNTFSVPLIKYFIRNEMNTGGQTFLILYDCDVDFAGHASGP